MAVRSMPVPVTVSSTIRELTEIIDGKGYCEHDCHERQVEVCYHLCLAVGEWWYNASLRLVYVSISIFFFLWMPRIPVWKCLSRDLLALLFASFYLSARRVKCYFVS